MGKHKFGTGVTPFNSGSQKPEPLEDWSTGPPLRGSQNFLKFLEKIATLFIFRASFFHRVLFIYDPKTKYPTFSICKSIFEKIAKRDRVNLLKFYNFFLKVMASGGLYFYNYKITAVVRQPQSTWSYVRPGYFIHQSCWCSGFILVHTNLPQAGFELGSLGPRAGVLPIEPPLLVDEKTLVVEVVGGWLKGLSMSYAACGRHM